MKIALCDDNGPYLAYLKRLIENHLLEEDVSIQTFMSAEEMLFQMGSTIPFDLVILDIQMGKMNGMDLANVIRKKDPHVYIVFITGINDYVYDGYEVGALRYLLKPLKEDQLFKILDDVKVRLTSTQIRYHIFQVGSETIKVSLNDILYFEALGHYVIIHTTTTQFEVKSSLNQLLSDLNDDLFLLVHRSFVVNLRHVERINKDHCLLSNYEIVSVSRSHYKLLNDKFISYIRGIKNV